MILKTNKRKEVKKKFGWMENKKTISLVGMPNGAQNVASVEQDFLVKEFSLPSDIKRDFVLHPTSSRRAAAAGGEHLVVKGREAFHQNAFGSKAGTHYDSL